MLRISTLCLALFLFIIVSSSAFHTSASADPVMTFIIEADSIARAGGDELLVPYVQTHAILVGAAVGQLLDVAFEIGVVGVVGEAGDKAAEEENVAFAELVARLFRDGGGSGVPMELVMIYRGWTPEQRVARAEIKALEASGFETRDAGEYDRAVEIFNRVVELSEKIDDRRTIAVTWGSLGVVHWYRGDMATVEQSYIKALEARRAIEDRILEGKTLNGLGSVNFQTGNYEKAVEYYDQAAALRRRTGDLGGLGTSLTYRGNAYYKMNRLVEARQSYEEAFEILEVSGSPGRLLEVLNSIAGIYFEMGSLKRSNEYYLRAIDVAASVDQPQDEATCRMNLAGNLRQQSRFTDALAQLEAAQPLLDQVPDPVNTATFYCERGLTWLAMGELDRAREDILAYVQHTEPLDDPYHQIEALIELGYLYHALGAFEQGLQVADRAGALAEESENTRLLRSAHVLSAVMYQSLGRNEEALAERLLALEIDRQSEADAYIIEDQMAIASINALLGKTEQARASFYSLQPEIRELGRTDLEWTIPFGIGHTFENENPDSAAFHYEQGLDLVEQSRAAVGGAETQSGFLSGERRYFYEEVARYYALTGERQDDEKWYERAFATMERAKARSLLDLMERPALAEITAGEQAVLDSLYQVTGDTPAEIESRRQLEGRYVELRETRLKDTFGGLAHRGSIAGIEEVRKTLPRKTALLEYALGDTLSLLWVIDRKGFDCYTLPDRRTLEPKIVQLRDGLTRPGPGDASVRRAARDLYQVLVLPAEGRLQKADKLIIAPDGILFEVPFEVLLTGDSDESAAWSELPFLVRSFETAYTPSASVLVRLRETKKQKYDFDLLAMGDPDFSLLGGGGAGGGSGALAALPYTRAEVDNISALVKDNKKRVFLGGEASESALKRELAAGTPRVLHLATHGLVDPFDPVNSSVVLCPDASTGDDGYIYTLEILSLPLDVGLVVLSACESGRGRVQRGEGVVGLSRAFIASGAGGVVASLWAVSDESTAELMSVFYTRMLGKKKSAAEAMTTARLALLDNPDYAHPFYWSPFVVIGTGGKEPW